MPICFRSGGFHGKQELPGKDQAEPSSSEWREPPGYLGEAVRRAKLISGKSRPQPARRPKD